MSAAQSDRWVKWIFLLAGAGLGLAAGFLLMAAYASIVGTKTAERIAATARLLPGAQDPREAGGGAVIVPMPHLDEDAGADVFIGHVQLLRQESEASGTDWVFAGAGDERLRVPRGHYVLHLTADGPRESAPEEPWELDDTVILVGRGDEALLLHVGSGDLRCVRLGARGTKQAGFRVLRIDPSDLELDMADLELDETPLEEARTGRVKADIAMIEVELDIFAINNGGHYPGSLSALTGPDAQGNTYLDEGLPLDPWGREYLYQPPGPDQPRPIVRTLGADGKPGGAGDDRDQDNFTIRQR